MPFALVLIGVILLVAAVQNTTPQLFTLIKGDFTGPNNFIYWFVAILIIGAIGYIPDLKKLSVAFLTLVIIVLFLSRGNANGIGGGFFQQFTTALGATQSGSLPTSTVSPTGSGSLLTGTTGILGTGATTSGLPNLSNILA
jgi:hypothetical protein